MKPLEYGERTSKKSEVWNKRKKRATLFLTKSISFPEVVSRFTRFTDYAGRGG